GTSGRGGSRSGAGSAGVFPGAGERAPSPQGHKARGGSGGWGRAGRGSCAGLFTAPSLPRALHTGRMTALPSGTVTFVFSDIEGSTALQKQLGDGYHRVLSDHRRRMRDPFTGRGGVEIDTQGDAFFFAFPRARDAVEAAV